MAQVDFSSATISSVNQNTVRTIAQADLGVTSAIIVDENANQIANITSTTDFSESVTQRSIRFVGSFTASGTKFYLRLNAVNSANMWEVSNISFSSGDLFDFIIDISLSVS